MKHPISMSPRSCLFKNEVKHPSLQAFQPQSNLAVEHPQCPRFFDVPTVKENRKKTSISPSQFRLWKGKYHSKWAILIWSWDDFMNIYKVSIKYLNIQEAILFSDHVRRSSKSIGYKSPRNGSFHQDVAIMLPDNFNHSMDCLQGRSKESLIWVIWRWPIASCSGIPFMEFWILINNHHMLSYHMQSSHRVMAIIKWLELTRLFKTNQLSLHIYIYMYI